MFKFFKKKQEENITDRFSRLMNEDRPQEALKVIEEIIEANPNISTSYFNYGICLSSLGKYDAAAGAFLKAYELDDMDGGSLYRACISLANSKNKDKLYKVFKSELERNPYMINNFIEEEMFNEFFSQSDFLKLKDQYADYIGKEEEE